MTKKGFHFFDRKNGRKETSRTSKQKEKKRVAGGRKSDTDLEADRQARRLTGKSDTEMETDRQARRLAGR